MQGCRSHPAPFVVSASGWLFEPRVARLPKPLLAARRGAAPTDHTIASGTRRIDRSLNEVRLGVEYQVRQARITDIDRLASIGQASIRDAGSGTLDAADLLRQLVYLPNASLLVAESRRVLVGGALLVLRPSVTAGGYVGTIDFLVVGPGHDADRVTDVLLEELLRSAGNKGCATVEMAQPSDPTNLARLERAGFAAAGPVLRRLLAVAHPARRP